MNTKLFFQREKIFLERKTVLEKKNTFNYYSFPLQIIINFVAVRGGER